MYINSVLISIISKIKKFDSFIFIFPAFNRLQRMLVLTAYNELSVIMRKTDWPLKLVITNFYCTYIHYLLEQNEYTSFFTYTKCDYGLTFLFLIFLCVKIVIEIFLLTYHDYHG
jgi:hypothetical protein